MDEFTDPAALGNDEESEAFLRTRLASEDQATDPAKLGREWMARLELEKIPGKAKPIHQQVATLKDRYKRMYVQQAIFEAGVLVQWKDDMKNKIFPDYGALAIVVKVLPEPITCPDFRVGSPYFREPLDIVIAHVDSDGDFIEMYCDSRRFDRYIPESEKKDD